MELKKVLFENGVYRWSCGTDDVQKQYECTVSVRMGVGVSAFMMLAGSLVLRNEELVLMFLSCGITVLITIICGRFLLNRKECETVPYMMTENGIRIREGRGVSYISFKRVHYAEARDNLVMLHTRFSKIPVYIPREDFEQIRGIIEERVEEKGKTP